MMLNRFVFVCALVFFIPLCISAQQNDSLSLAVDSTKIIDSTKAVDSTALSDSTNLVDSSLSKLKPFIAKTSDLDRIIGDNIFLNSKSKPVTFIQSLRKTESKEVTFYILALVVLMFAVLKVLYPRYFSNLFRVFFNTSLRQSQLTDQLLQAKLPSLLYNIFFTLMGGWYLYLLLSFSGKADHYPRWELLLICAACLATIYMGKFCMLKFTGWITGYKQEADTYIFIIFLINKIVAICLIPLVIIMAFSESGLANIAMLLSFIVIAVMILMRFFRSYSLLQNRLKVSRLHFFIYIIGIEIVPLLIIYKLALIFMSKNL
jgi:hypothetical protein